MRGIQWVDALSRQNWGPLSGPHFGASLSSSIPKKNSNSDAGESSARAQHFGMESAKFREPRGGNTKTGTAQGQKAERTILRNDTTTHACTALSPCLVTVRVVPCPGPSAATVCPPAVFCSLRSPCFLPAARSSSSVRARAPPPAACSIPSRSWPLRCQGAAQPFACSLASLRSRSTRRVPCLPPCFLSYDHVPQMHPCAPCGFRRDRAASHACQRAVRAHCAFFYLSGHIARSCLQRVLVPRWQHAHRARRTAGEADCAAQTMQVAGDPRTAGTTLWWSRGFRQAADPAADAQYTFKKFGTYSARRPGASASSAD